MILFVVKKEIKDEEDNSGTGTRTGSTPLFSKPRDIKKKTKLLTFVFSFDLQQLAKRSDRPESRYKRVACF